MDYVSVRVSTLRGDQKINFNVFVKVNEKMILYLREGDSFEGIRLQRLKDKKLKKLFILNDDELKYRNYVQKNIEGAYDPGSKTDIHSRAEIIQGTQQNNVEEVFENPESATSYNAAKEASSKYVDFLLNSSDAVQSILAIENTDQSLAHHGVNVATFSVALGQRMGITDPGRTQLLTLGALLHDLGHADSAVLPGQLLKSMTPEELKIYKKHCEVGAMKVQDKRHFDPAVVNIIMKHEECVDGTGFPYGLKQSEQDELVQIVSSCNALDRLITFENVPRSSAAQKMMMTQVGKHPLEHIQFLAECIR